MTKTIAREVVYMIMTLKLLPKEKKSKKKNLNVKYCITSKKNLPQLSTIYHVLQVNFNFLKRIIVLYYKPLVVLWYTFLKKGYYKNFLSSLFLPIVYLSYT